MLKFSTSGESHGKGLIGIIEGIPSGVHITEDLINHELQRRQQGYGRGARMEIENDQVEVFSGIRNCLTLGTPIGFVLKNKDYENWQDIMGAGLCLRGEEKAVKRPRPGHADLAGAIKYNHRDMRNILERASARETAARVAAGAIFKQFLKVVDIKLYSQVLSISQVCAQARPVTSQNIEEICYKTDISPVRCLDKEAEAQMLEAIDQARVQGESLGGSFEVGAVGVPPGLGSHVSWERKLDALLAGLLMSIPAIKAVEIGDGIINSSKAGSMVHDEIFYGDNGLYRKTNRAGGIEGGISNGEFIWARAYMKPIPTLYKPLTSVDTEKWCEVKADIERSDICAVPAAAVIGEAMLSYGLARVFLEKFPGDNIEETEAAYSRYRNYMKKVWQWEKI